MGGSARFRNRPASALLALTALPAASLAASGVAAAATGCPTMTLTGTTTALRLEPATVTVDAGGCVEFANATALTATFTVGSYHQQVASGDHTSGGTDYRATPAGTTQKVTASELLGSARGSIVIRAATGPTPAPTATAVAPPPPHSSPQPTTSARQGVTSPALGPSAPAATGPIVPVPSAPPTGSAVVSPSAAAPFVAGRPTPAQSSPAPAVVAGPIQPATGRGTGLPGAVAALAVVATAGALLRVLLAEPVLSTGRRRSVGAALYSSPDATG